MFNLKASCYIVEAAAEERNRRVPLSNDALKSLAQMGLNADVAVNPARLKSNNIFHDDPTPNSSFNVENTRIFDGLALPATLLVNENGSAQLTVNTIPPLQLEGDLVRLDGVGRSVAERDSLKDQLVFVPAGKLPEILSPINLT
jgi:hypothetical protein